MGSLTAPSINNSNGYENIANIISYGLVQLTLGNLIEEPGSLDYEYEGDAMRIYGLIGLILYAMLFDVVLLFLSRKKRNLFIFLSLMILSGIILGIYIFALRG